MDDWSAGDRHFIAILSSGGLTRDGMVLELEEVTPGKTEGWAGMGIFRDEATGTMTFSARNVDELPVELIERFIAAARQRLPPVPGYGASPARCGGDGREVPAEGEQPAQTSDEVDR